VKNSPGDEDRLLGEEMNPGGERKPPLSPLGRRTGSPSGSVISLFRDKFSNVLKKKEILSFLS